MAIFFFVALSILFIQFNGFIAIWWGMFAEIVVKYWIFHTRLKFICAHQNFLETFYLRVSENDEKSKAAKYLQGFVATRQERRRKNIWGNDVVGDSLHVLVRSYSITKNKETKNPLGKFFIIKYLNLQTWIYNFQMYLNELKIVFPFQNTPHKLTFDDWFRFYGNC